MSLSTNSKCSDFFGRKYVCKSHNFLDGLLTNTNYKTIRELVSINSKFDLVLETCLNSIFNQAFRFQHYFKCTYICTACYLYPY